MNNAQARFVLQSYRPDGSDARDPAFAEALEQARRDPSLARWLDQETQQDLQLRAKLNTTPVPPGLLDDLLAVRKVHVRPFSGVRPQRWLALAAGLALLLGIVWSLWRPPAMSFAAYAQAATDYVSGPLQMDLNTRDLAELRGWMRAQGADPALALPETLAAAVESGVGCKAFMWRGEPVRLVCFTLEGGRLAHLFMMDAKALPDAPGEDAMLFAQRGQWATATWTAGGQAFVLATAGQRRDVEVLL